MKTPNILSYTTLKKSGELNDKYLKAIENSGGKLQMIDSVEDIDTFIGQADGILLPGGNDVNPMLYGEERKSYTQEPNDERDKFEFYLIEKAMEKKLPILGICRGLQIINVKFGGSLYQDIQEEMPGSIRHDWHEENSEPLPRSLLAHPMLLDENSRLHRLIGEGKIEVNSLHHQGIKKLGNGLQAMGHSPDGLVEYVEMPDYPYLVAMQWHPEELTATPVWKNFFNDFIKVCTN